MGFIVTNRVGIRGLPSLSLHGDVTGDALVSSPSSPRDGVENAPLGVVDAAVGVLAPPPLDMSSLATTDDLVLKPVHDMTVSLPAEFNEQRFVLFDDGEVVTVCVVGVLM